MIEQTARVIEHDGRHVWVEVDRAHACPRCAQGRGCGGGLLAGIFGRRKLRVRARSQERWALQDRVIVGLHEAALLKAAATVYLVPILTMLIIGAAAGLLADRVNSGASEALVIGGAILGLVLGLVWAHRHGSQGAGTSVYEAVVLRSASSAAPEVEIGPDGLIDDFSGK